MQTLELSFDEGKRTERDGASRRAGSLPCLNRIFSNEKAESPLSPYHAKAAFALAFNVHRMCEIYGIERIGFLTITTGGKLGLTMKAFQKRYNSLNTGFLRARYPASIMVMERGDLNNRVHAHLLVALGQDIRTGFNFEEVKRKNYQSANHFLRHEWLEWRLVAPKYHFGRCELMPIKAGPEAIAKYVAKYIAKQVCKRLRQDRHMKLVRYSRDVRKCSTRFSFVSVRSYLWRSKLGKLAGKLGCEQLEDFSEKFGKRWCKHLAEIITSLTLEEYPSKAHAQDDGQSVSALPDDAVQVRVIGRKTSVESMTSEQVERYLRKDGQDTVTIKRLAHLMEVSPGDFGFDVDGLRKARLPGLTWEEYAAGKEAPTQFEFVADPDWETDIWRENEPDLEPF